MPLLLLLTILAASAEAQSTPSVAPTGPERDSGGGLRVWLVTAGPGDAVWERYGHNAIRVLDTATGRDVSYNWGIFDFDQVDFVPRFLRGEMLYSMVSFSTPAMVDSYRRAGREVVLQELALTPSQKVRLRDLADRNALPENRDYVYHYFLDNCSTRVRDLLDLVLEGALSRQFSAEPTGVSYRFHTRRLAQGDPAIAAGMDLLLGSATDAPITVWEEMFLPATVRDALRTVTVRGPDGAERPLVLGEDVVVPSDRPPEPIRPRSTMLFYASLGLLLGGLLSTPSVPGIGHTRSVHLGTTALGIAWSLVAGLIGTILVLLLFTDHTFAHWNENLLLYSPLSLLLALGMVATALRPRWHRYARTLAALVLALALAGVALQLFPGAVQANGEFLLLAIPAHLGLFVALRRSP